MYNSLMENKTFNNFVNQIATMYDPNSDEIRDVIATIILAAAHDNDLVNAAFEWVRSRNNKNAK